MHNFPNKDPGEKITLTFDFSAELINETIVSATVTIAVVTGVDAGASAMLNGVAALSSDSVLQSVLAGLNGVTYRLTCTAITATRTLILAGTLRVRSAT